MIEALRCARKYNELSVFEIVDNMRRSRMGCVQTLEQYNFIYNELKNMLWWWCSSLLLILSVIQMVSWKGMLSNHDKHQIRSFRVCRWRERAGVRLSWSFMEIERVNNFKGGILYLLNMSDCNRTGEADLARDFSESIFLLKKSSSNSTVAIQADFSPLSQK